MPTQLWDVSRPRYTLSDQNLCINEEEIVSTAYLLQMRTKLSALIVWAMLRTAEGNAGYEMNVYRESPGVYFENLGRATLSNTAWTIVVYAPIQITG